MPFVTDNCQWNRQWLRGIAYAVSLVSLCACNVLAADGGSAGASPALLSTDTPVTFLATLPDGPELAPVTRPPRLTAMDAALPPVVAGHRSSPMAGTAKMGRAADRNSLVRWTSSSVEPNGVESNGDGRGRPSWRPEGIIGPWPADEYICDGGDRETRVVVNQNWEVSGLDLEDTIAHYDTVDGRTIVTPSNSVCIYAPRFAAVRKIVQTSVDERLLVMSELDQPLPPLTDTARRRANVVDQPLPSRHDVSLKGPIALRDRTRGVDLQKVLPAIEMVRDFAAHEDLQIIRLGIHRRSEQPLLAEASQAALQWTDNLAPEVILDDEVAEVDVRVQKAEAVYHLGQGPPRLRVIKIASSGSALPGEEITFTLRFDNIGEQTIGNVTLLDNLTTRLEYIPDTTVCTLAADFYADENEGESLALRWEIREPIKPGEGGAIRFRCRVR